MLFTGATQNFPVETHIKVLTVPCSLWFTLTRNSSTTLHLLTDWIVQHVLWTCDYLKDQRLRFHHACNMALQLRQNNICAGQGKAFCYSMKFWHHYFYLLGCFQKIGFCYYETKYLQNRVSILIQIKENYLNLSKCEATNI